MNHFAFPKEQQQRKRLKKQSQDKLEPIASPMSDWNWKK